MFMFAKAMSDNFIIMPISNLQFSKACEELKSSDFKGCFQSLEISSVEELRNFFNLVNLTNAAKQKEFWDVFAIFIQNHNWFIKDEFSFSILHLFWKNYPNIGIEFHDVLLREYPDRFIDSLRLNFQFLEAKEETVVEKLLSQLLSNKNERVRTNALFISYCRVQREQYTKQLCHLTEKLGALSFSELLCHLCLWYESKRVPLVALKLEGVDVSGEQQTFMSCIDEAIQNFEFTQDDIQQHSNDEEAANKELVGVIASWISGCEIRGHIEELMDWILRFRHYEGAVLNNYYFNLNWEVSLDSKSFKLFAKDLSSDVEMVLNGEKLTWWFKSELCHAIEKVERMVIEKQSTPKGTTEREKQNNQLFISLQTWNEILLDYYAILKTDDQLLQLFVRFATGYQCNALIRYVQPIDLLHRQNPKMWLHNLLLLLKDESMVGWKLPMRVQCVRSWQEQIRNDVKLPEISIVESATYLLAHNAGIDSKKKISISNRPFIIYRDLVYTFSNVLAETNIGNSIISSYLNSKEYAKTKTRDTSEMEKQLCELFKQVGFNAIYSQKFEGSEEGDMDILVYEDGHLLAIELKRSLLRISNNEIWNERMGSLRKASLQLDKFKTFFNVEPAWLRERFEINESIEINTLIVSTSFEYDHELIGKHLKISLFELKNLLFQMDFDFMRKHGLNPIVELMKQIKEDSFWQPIMAQRRKELEVCEREIVIPFG